MFYPVKSRDAGVRAFPEWCRTKSRSLSLSMRGDRFVPPGLAMTDDLQHTPPVTMERPRPWSSKFGRALPAML
jgi:hypothetical protein